MRHALTAFLLLLLVVGAEADPPSVQTDREGARTLPLPKGDDVFHFVVYGDRTGGPASGIKVLKQAVRETNLLDPDLVMTVGDLIQGYNGSQAWMAQMQEYHGVMQGLAMPWYPVAGNHDVYWRGSKPPAGHHEADYEKHFGPLWYSFQHKNAAFIALYTDEGDAAKNQKGWGNPRVNPMSAAQLAWLAATLEKTKQADHVFVFLHHPKWRTDYYKGSNWHKAHALLKDAGNVSAVFAGHMHRRRYHGQRDGIDYYTLAAVGGAMPFSIPGTGHLHHMDVVTVRKDGYAVATIPVGSVLDPKEMTPERITDIDSVRRMPMKLLGESIEVTVDGMAAGKVGLELANPATRPLDVRVEVEAPDRGWRFQLDHVHARIEPGQKHTFVFPCYRREGEGLDGFEIPWLRVETDYVGETLRVNLPTRTVHLDVGFGDLPAAFFRDAPNRALALDGRSGCLAVPPGRVELPDGPFTLEGWVKADTFHGRRGFITKAEYSEYGIFVSNGQPGFSVFLSGAYVAAQGKQGTLTPGRWIHLAGVYDGTHVRMYVDGKLVAKAPGSGKRKPNGLPLLIGADVDKRGRGMSHIAGRIDEVRLSSVARYTAEAFEPPKRHAPDADTVLLYHFDRRLGAFAPDHTSAARHAVARGRVAYEPVAADEPPGAEEGE